MLALSLIQGDTSHVSATDIGLENQMGLQQTLRHLSIVHRRIRNILSNNRELYENPPPRLFFILPKASQARNNTGGPAPKQFRLYFLCDCGQHTSTYISKVRHEVHVAKHEGYDLERPKEFLKRYGLYTMAMMQMIKYGFEEEGIVIPELTESDLTSNIDGAQRHINFATKSITSLIDETISYIQHLRDDIGGYSENDENKTELGTSREEESLDLQQIDSYLNIENEEQTLGNLSRIITQDRHVRWVCSDHSREIYRDSAVQELKTFVDANQGTFIEEKGRVIMKIESRAMAKEFYRIMSKNCGIQELETAFEFNASLKTLDVFSSVVTKANILSLSLNGQNINVGNTTCSRTFGPIMKIMCNKRIQSIQLQNFKDLHLHTNVPTVDVSDQLRILQLDSFIPFMEGSARSFFTKVLESCPRLVEIRLQTDHVCFPYYLIMEKINHFKMLKTVVIQKNWYQLKLAFTSGETQAVSLNTLDLRSLSKRDQEFACDGHLTSLSVWCTLVSGQESRLADIISNNRNLVGVTIGSHAECSLAVLQLCILARKRSLQMASSPSPLMSMVVKMRATARMIMSDSVHRLFSLFSWTIKTLETNRTFTDNLDFSITFTSDQTVSNACVDWICTIVSAPTQVSSPNPVSRPRSMLSRDSVEQLSVACMPLTSISLVHAVIDIDGWKKLLESLDFFTLEVLDLTSSNFSFEDLSFLTYIIPDEGDLNVALKVLKLEGTKIAESDYDYLALRMCDEIERKAPHINIEGL
ncbi:hypothetical protein BGZ79_009252 [Entomortierella chlamydospora]|nr:hypothetical protein BGZ79_009252 [Entomortierella chlamydospora]